MHLNFTNNELEAGSKSSNKGGSLSLFSYLEKEDFEPLTLKSSEKVVKTIFMQVQQEDLSTSFNKQSLKVSVQKQLIDAFIGLSKEALLPIKQGEKVLEFLEKNPIFKEYFRVIPHLNGFEILYRNSQKSHSFFTHKKGRYYKGIECAKKIDENKKKLGKQEAKFFLLNISPSREEQLFLLDKCRQELELPDSEIQSKKLDKKFREVLEEYTRVVMEKYAINFTTKKEESGVDEQEITLISRGLQSKDLLWFGKIELNRVYKFKDSQVKKGLKKRGEAKEGLNAHVHVVISRKCIENKRKLSPLTSHRATQGGRIPGGFDRVNFFINSMRAFDEKYHYPRLAHPLMENQFNKWGAFAKKNVYEQFLKQKISLLKEGKVDEILKINGVIHQQFLEDYEYTRWKTSKKEVRQTLKNRLDFCLLQAKKQHLKPIKDENEGESSTGVENFTKFLALLTDAGIFLDLKFSSPVNQRVANHSTTIKGEDKGGHRMERKKGLGKKKFSLKGIRVKDTYSQLSFKGSTLGLNTKELFNAFGLKLTSEKKLIDVYKTWQEYAQAFKGAKKEKTPVLEPIVNPVKVKNVQPTSKQSQNKLVSQDVSSIGQGITAMFLKSSRLPSENKLLLANEVYKGLLESNSSSKDHKQPFQTQTKKSLWKYIQGLWKNLKKGHSKLDTVLYDLNVMSSPEIETKRKAKFLKQRLTRSELIKEIAKIDLPLVINPQQELGFTVMTTLGQPQDQYGSKHHEQLIFVNESKDVVRPSQGKNIKKVKEQFTWEEKVYYQTCLLTLIEQKMGTSIKGTVNQKKVKLAETKIKHQLDDLKPTGFSLIKLSNEKYNVFGGKTKKQTSLDFSSVTENMQDHLKTVLLPIGFDKVTFIKKLARYLASISIDQRRKLNIYSSGENNKILSVQVFLEKKLNKKEQQLFFHESLQTLEQRLISKKEGLEDKEALEISKRIAVIKQILKPEVTNSKKESPPSKRKASKEQKTNQINLFGSEANPFNTPYQRGDNKEGSDKGR